MFAIWNNTWDEGKNTDYMFDVYVCSLFALCLPPMPQSILHPFSLSLHLLLNLHTCSIDPPFTGNQCLLSNPHSNAVIDLNGDCLAGR